MASGGGRGEAPRVVLHADDFGMNAAVSRGILQGFEQGLLTSASVLTNAPHAAQALSAWKELLRAQAAGRLPSSEVRRRVDDPHHPFDLGVHLNLTQGRPLTAKSYPAELLEEQGRFPGPGALFRTLRRGGARYQTQILQELSAQIEAMLDHGLRPTHLNGHQYVEMMPGVAELIPRLVEQYDIPAVRVPRERRAWLASFLPGFRCANALLALVKRYYAASYCRLIDRQRIAHPDAFFGSSHAGCIDLRLLRRFLDHPAQFALAEVALHPAFAAEAQQASADDDGWRDPLASARPQELQLLCSQELADFFLRRPLRLGRIALANHAFQAAAVATPVPSIV
jgi:predicted glycoside hydrolase/deacetylase ChbG (UPF0249 family)